MFNWDDLRFFIEVVRARSLSGAAAKLGVRHTTVARRLQSLEQTLQARLFDKTPAGYLPTATGSKLLTLAEEVESSCMSAADLVAGQDAVLTGTVRLGVPEGFGAFLGTRLSSFYSEYPGLDIEMVAGTQFLSISKREADLAVTLSRPRVGRLVARKLSDYTLRLFGSRAYLRKHGPVGRIEDLRALTLIGYIDDLIYAPQLRYLDEILPQARVKLRTSSINAQLAAVEAGLGLSILPCFLADTRPTLEPILPKEIEITRTFWLSMHQDLQHVRRVEAVWNWLTALVADQQPLITGH